MNRRMLLQSGSAAALALIFPVSARASILKAGAVVSLKCLGSAPGPRYLDGRTVGGTVGLAPELLGHFTGTKWSIWAGGGEIELKCMGSADGPRWLDGRTGDGSVGLAPSTDPPFTGTRWEAAYYPVEIDQGSEGRPASN